MEAIHLCGSARLGSLVLQNGAKITREIKNTRSSKGSRKHFAQTMAICSMHQLCLIGDPAIVP